MTLTTSKAVDRLNPPVFPPEPSWLRKLPKEIVMRLVGRVGVGLHRTMGSRAGSGVGILTYHRVTAHVPRVPAPLFNVTPRRFRDQLAEAARETGVTCGLTTECAPVDPASDPYSWGRFNVFPWDTSTTLAAKLASWYGWAPSLNRSVARVVGMSARPCCSLVPRVFSTATSHRRSNAWASESDGNNRGSSR